nr:MAG TPA: hypothetical protein [Caudoviricetes sp.]
MLTEFLRSNRYKIMRRSYIRALSTYRQEPMSKQFVSDYHLLPKR